MKKEFTREEMIANKGCYSLEQLNQCSFMQNEEISLFDILDSEIPLKDKFWFCCKKVFTKEQNQLISITVAENVLDIYEIKYPGNKTPREAIQAAKDYLNNSITLEVLSEKRKAAFADAADAAAAVYAAVYAYAAYIASTKSTNYRLILLQSLIDFCNKAK